jgi:hypothetical protein
LILLAASLTFFSAAACNRAETEIQKKAEPTNSHTTETTKSDASIPPSLVAEHKELHHMLEEVITSGGKTGDAAKVVAERLDPHFKKEEEYAMPPLTLLVPLSQGKVSPDMKGMMEKSAKLKAELPQMLNEHKSIVVALDTLVGTAKEENKPAAIQFAEKLRLHAQNEEEILYPAAILVGDYLRLRMEPAPERSVNRSEDQNKR